MEGESLLNDASALLIYRLALGAVAARGFSLGAVAPTFLIAITGSLILGPALGWLTLRVLDRLHHVPTAIILQFVTTFGIWMLADSLGLSAVLTMVCFAVTVAQTSPARTPARTRIPTTRYGTTVVSGGARAQYRSRVGLLTVMSCACLAYSFKVVVAPAFWVSSTPTMLRPSVGSGLIISWSGMRGIVSLAAAMALPAAFPYRDLIVLTAFAVVVGTLVIQGLTLKPLLRALNLHDDDPVARELRVARERALRAGLAALANDESTVATAVRQEFAAHLTDRGADATTEGQSRSVHADLHRAAVAAARQAVLTMRANNEIGDDAFHLMEGELDWLEMAYGGTG